MVELLDKKDKKILNQLELDATQNYSKIAQKVGISNELSRYRILRLEKEGIIDKYVTILNAKKIGYESFKWYLQLEHTNKTKLDELISVLQNHPNCVWITTCAGKWDLIVVFFCTSSLQFDKIIHEFSLKFAKNIRLTKFTIELDIYHFKKKYLSSDQLVLYKTPYFGGDSERLALRTEEVKILTHLCENPKIGLVELSKKTNLSVDIVRDRIKKMKTSGLIQGSRIQINNEKLGLESYKILLNARRADLQREKGFISYLQHHKSIADVIHCLGDWNMEINVDVKNSAEFHNLIMDLKDKFPEIIEHYDFLQFFKNYKYNFFPMGRSILQSEKD